MLSVFLNSSVYNLEKINNGMEFRRFLRAKKFIKICGWQADINFIGCDYMITQEFPILFAKYKQQSILMFFNDYSQFLESQPEMVSFMPGPKDLKFSQASNFLAPPVLNRHHDLVYSEFTEIVSKRLVTQPYPSTFQNFNPFCPLCLKFVENGSFYTTCYINDDRNYLIHQQCLSKDKSYEIRNIGEVLENLITYQQCETKSKYRFEKGLDSRNFYVEIALTHPINDKKFIKVNQKVSLVRDHFNITLNQNQTDSYLPNVILVPLTDYHLTVNISQVGRKGSNVKLVKYLKFKNAKGKKRIMVKCEQAMLQVEIIQNKEEKIKLSEAMNYKFKYPIDQNLPLLRIYGFKISLPQQFQEESDEQYIIGSSSTIVEELLNEKDHSLSAIKTSQPSPKKYPFSMTDSNSSHEHNENQKVNLSKLISTNKLIQFVKNNNQSRLFQNYLSECSSADIQLIIPHIKQKIAELITHQYGNYMVQKLFKVCSPAQRLQIIQYITPQIPEIARNKQGTHTIQAFITQFTLSEQYSLVSIEITKDFYELCRHNNATHFIQKIIKTFPLQYTIGFFHYITENLMAFALDKNAMCVIKHMMRQLRQLQGKYEAYDQAIDMVRRQLIFNVTFNVDRLIMDSYGNYVIQFCYELYDLQRCAGITERILSKFAYYSMGKFASNVLLKCISAYWIDKRVYQSLRSLPSNHILEIFRNKDGNKILLEMMERLEGLQVWDRIYGVLIQVQPSRFYHDRWGVVLGSRSGQVGTRLTGFPEARKKTYNRRY